MEVVASLSQARTAAAQCGLFTYISVPVIFEPPCNLIKRNIVVFDEVYILFHFKVTAFYLTFKTVLMAR